jgi:hypothetical protein
VRASWRLGALPALPVVVLFFAVATAAALLGDEATMDIVGGVLVLALLAYCVARPANGTDLFFAVAAPGAIAQLAHEFLGAPRWLFFVLLPIALVGAWNADHDDADDSDPDDDASEDVGPGARRAPAARA